jgi:hypothetical protein
MHKPLIISECIGLKIGRLIIVKYDYKKGRHHYFLVRCECGVEKSIGWDNFKSGRQKSCGCIMHEGFLSTKHPLYKIWCGVKQRCYNKNNQAYSAYGGRGVKMCDEWLNDFEAFAKWSEANGWAPGLEIDKDKNQSEGGLLYAPHVCCWVTHAENMRYIRRHKTVWWQVKGRSKSLTPEQIVELKASKLKREELSKIYRVSIKTLQRAINGKATYK